jgi:transglutaminase-like putative cysteine protease
VSADTGPRRYEVRHRTEYGYAEEVTASYGRAYLAPRDAPGQWCRSSRLEVSPRPGILSERADFFGNRCTYLEVHDPHTRLTVTAVSQVDVDRPAADLAALDDWSWERARDALADWPDEERPAGIDPAGIELPGMEPAGIDQTQARGFLLPSPQVPDAPAVAAYADTVFTPGRPLGEAITALVHRIHTDLRYLPGATSVSTTLPEVLSRQAGVCQDFAHLAVGCLRHAGLPARYVSGYLETSPPPGRPRLQGADASHAWVSVLLPELGWVDVDPTNDRVVDSSYVVTAWGRDYFDIPPLKGVIFTESKESTLRVAVDVLRV